MTKDYEVPALKRAGDILALLAKRAAPVKTSELMEATGLAKSSLYLILDSLAQRRWVEKHPSGYTVGIGLYVLGTAYLRHDNLHETFRTAATHFVEQYGEVVQLAVLEGHDVVYLAREDSRQPVRLVSDLGSRLPAHACALGKALLASLSDDEVLALLPEQLSAVTPKTITDHNALLAELAEVRRTGVGFDREEIAAGLFCMAAYIGETALGKRVAVSTSVPVNRLDGKRRKAIEKGILMVACQIAARVGKRGDR